MGGQGAPPRVAPDGLLWVVYPKGGEPAGTDINRDILRERLEERGLTVGGDGLLRRPVVGDAVPYQLK